MTFPNNGLKWITILFKLLVIEEDKKSYVSYIHCEIIFIAEYNYSINEGMSVNIFLRSKKKVIL